MNPLRSVALAFASALVLTAGCDCGGPVRPTPCVSNDDCTVGTCIDGECTEVDASGLDGGGLDGGGIDAGTCETVVCGAVCCRGGERCAFATCVPVIGACASNDDCTGDSYCDAEGQCTPYGVPPTVTLDEDCERPIVVGEFLPAEQCRWSGGTSGTAYDAWNQVYSAPMVADFDLDDDRAVLAPSIVFSSFDGSSDGGVLRVIDGRTCTCLLYTSGVSMEDSPVYVLVSTLPAT